MIDPFHLSVEISQCYICLISFPSRLTCCLLVLAHTLPQFTMYSFGSHKLVPASGVGLLPKVPGILTSIEHLHHGEHGTHSGTRTVCLLISVLEQCIAVALCPYYYRWIHLRKSTSSTAGKLIPMLLTYTVSAALPHNDTTTPAGEISL